MASGYAWSPSSIGGGGAFGRAAAHRAGQYDVILVSADVAGLYQGSYNGTYYNFAAIGSQTGLIDQNCYAAAIDPVDVARMYVCTEGGTGSVLGGLQRTVDGGATWTKCQDGNSADITTKNWLEVVTAPSDANYVYAVRMASFGSGINELWRSTNRGANFSQVATFASTIRILKLIVNASDPTHLFFISGNFSNSRTAVAGVEQSVYRSADAGVTWTRIGPGGYYPLIDFGASPTQEDPEIIFVVTNSNGVWKSTDSGSSWAQLNIGGSLTRRGCIAVGRQPAASSESLGWGATPPFVALMDPEQSTSTTKGTWLSRDGGSSWVFHRGVDGWGTAWKGTIFKGGMYSRNTYGYAKTINMECPYAPAPNRIIWTTSQFCFCSTDMGVTFQPMYTVDQGSGTFSSTGIDNIEITGLSGSGETIYAACYDIGANVSRDFGASWKNINSATYGWSDGFGAACLTILTDPDRDNVVWTALCVDPSDCLSGCTRTYPVAYQLLRSTDYGSTWNPVTLSGSPFTGEFFGLALDPSSSSSERTLYVTRNGDVYKSTDDGLTWTLFFSNGGMRQVAADGLNVVMGGEGGLWVTTDGGATTPIQQTTASFPVTALTDTPDKLQQKGVSKIVISGTTVYVMYFRASNSAGAGGLYSSSDVLSAPGSATWGRLLEDGWSRWVAIDTDGRLYHTSSSAAKAGGNKDSGSTGLKRYNGASWETLAQYAVDATLIPVWAEFAIPIFVESGAGNKRVMLGVPGMGFYRGFYTTI